LDENLHSFCEIDAEMGDKLRADLAKMERPKRRLIELMLAYSGMERRQKLEEILAANDGQKRLAKGRIHQINF
jgi:hypothetical protein